jgi:hypothetical protein
MTTSPPTPLPPARKPPLIYRVLALIALVTLVAGIGSLALASKYPIEKAGRNSKLVRAVYDLPAASDVAVLARARTILEQGGRSFDAERLESFMKHAVLLHLLERELPGDIGTIRSAIEAENYARQSLNPVWELAVDRLASQMEITVTDTTADALQTAAEEYQKRSDWSYLGDAIWSDPKDELHNMVVTVTNRSPFTIAGIADFVWSVPAESGVNVNFRCGTNSSRRHIGTGASVHAVCDPWNQRTELEVLRGLMVRARNEGTRFTPLRINRISIADPHVGLAGNSHGYHYVEIKDGEDYRLAQSAAYAEIRASSCAVAGLCAARFARATAVAIRGLPHFALMLAIGVLAGLIVAGVSATPFRSARTLTAVAGLLAGGGLLCVAAIAPVYLLMLILNPIRTISTVALLLIGLWSTVVLMVATRNLSLRAKSVWKPA